MTTLRDRVLRLSLTAALLSASAGLALGQATSENKPAAQPSAPATAPAAPAAQANPTPPPGTPIPQAIPAFPIIYDKDKDGNAIPLGGNLDAIALTKNTLVSKADLEKMKPAIQEWTDDVNQMVVDNLDFFERLETEKLVDNLDIEDADRMRVVAGIMAPFAAVGGLAQRLEQKQLLTGNASITTQQAGSDYLQKFFDQFGSSPMPERGQSVSEQQREGINNLSRFAYYMANRDARVQYHAILLDASKMLADIEGAGSPTPEQKKKLDAAIAKVNAAKDDVGRINEMKVLIRILPMEQRRAMMMDAVKRGAGKDVFKFPPYVPHPYER
jgi:hypothetical protein